MANLLFLALSLLHSEKPSLTSDIKTSVFIPPLQNGDEEVKIEDEEILYLGQMDPIVIWKAQQYNEDDLIVVALCTDKVLRDPYSSEDPVTSAEFFMKSVSEATNKELDLSSYRKEYCRQEISTADGKIKFILIPVNEDDLHPGIKESVNAIREWNKTEERGKFWIDVHGGFRSTMTVLLGIITLLKIDGIVPDKVYSPRFDNKSRTMKLPETPKEIEIFNFVSSMDSFINYGNADLLNVYFGRHEASDYEKKVLAAIEKVAIGTQCCDTDSYKQGLTELSKLLKKPDPNESSLLGLFLDYIKNSYGELLTSKRTTLMIVKRCVDKKLYQQALTFIEASMPEEIVKKGLLTFAITNYQSEDNKRKARNNKLEYYLFDAYLKMGNIHPTRADKPLKQKVSDWAKQEEKLRKMLKGIKPGHLIMDTYVNKGRKNNDMPFDIMKTNMDVNMPNKIEGIDSKVPVKDREALGVFLRLHKLLKLCRNAYNHSLTDRPELSDLLKLFGLYIDYADYLYMKCS